MIRMKMDNKEMYAKIGKETFEYACNVYIVLFEMKQGIEFEGWVGDDIGGVACFGDYNFNLEEIRHDIDTNQKKNLIFKWIDESVEAYYNKEPGFNYKSWLSLRGKSKAQIATERAEDLRKSSEKVEEVRQQLMDTIEEYVKDNV